MTDGVPLDELYFRWLYEQVADPGFDDEDLTYWEVLKVLFSVDFAFIIRMDENRVEDGKALRRRFVEEKGLTGVSRDWIEIGCSVLELMVAMAERLSFLDLEEAPAYYWFWELMKNLGLDRYSDSHDVPYEDIEEILTRVIFRQYGPDGQGGFFPLKHPKRNQTKLELWAQLGDYIQEQEITAT
jgi:hypothetical protein